jgi:uncharacterized protein
VKKLAIVGTGMAGMSAAYFLHNDYDITVFEKNDYVGGHTNTVYFDEDGLKKPVDTGFMVFNEITYPLMIKLFKKLDVSYYDTDMSFSVYETKSGLEYNGSSMDGLFAQRKNIFNPSYIKMLLDVKRLCKLAPEIVSDPRFENLTVRDLMTREGYGENFLNWFLIPMSAAVWSTPHDKMLDFPAKTLVQFFLNHGFLGLDTQHQWKTVKEGSETYKKKIIKGFKERIRVGEGVTSAVKTGNGVKLTTTKGESFEFDFVVFASHADETLAILKEPTQLQRSLLQNFKYQENSAVLHNDASVMPKIRKNWSAWNFVYRENESYTVYYMNRLQKVSDKKEYFININGDRFVDSAKILKKIVYHHPLFDLKAKEAQVRLPELNTEGTKMFFCGSYFRYGFHEDALLSSVTMCETILGRKVL